MCIYVRQHALLLLAVLLLYSRRVQLHNIRDVPFLYHANSVSDSLIPEIEASAWKPGDKSTLTLQVAAHYYKLTVGDEELVEIDAVNLVRKVGGVDQMAEIRAAIGV